MTAKSKAFQAMAVISIAALTYTLSNSSSDGTSTKADPVKEQMMAPVIITAKTPKKQKATPPTETISSQGAVPGYSNPDESTR
jgi:hypothetical protein